MRSCINSQICLLSVFPEKCPILTIIKNNSSNTILIISEKEHFALILELLLFTYNNEI